MDASLILLLIALGLALGSFLGALTHRLPGQESIFKGRSKCPKCGKKIAWYDNIPLFSYIFLKGRCRRCNKKISPRYFLIELVTAVGFVCIYYLYVNCAARLMNLFFQSPLCIWGNKLSFFLLPFMLILFLVVLAIFAIDFEHQFIPDSLVFTGFTFVFFTTAFADPSSFYTRLLVAFGSGIFLLIIHLTTKGKGMGLGDVKFALFLGILLGWPYAFVSLLLAFLTGAVVGIILVLAGKAKLKEHVAFGPFLALSLIVTFVWGEKLLTLFL